MSFLDWTAELPDGWEAKPLRSTADYLVSNVDKVPAENEIPVRLCNYTDVYNNEFITLALDFMQATASEDEVAKFSVCVNDVIITKDSESWDDIGVPALVRETASDLVCGYHLALLRPLKQKINGAFLFRCLQAKPVRVQLELAANGVTRFGIPKSEIGTMTLPVPPLAQQRAIADYLDRETARLDALVAAKERVIGLLAEKRRALITRAVTRGLPAEAAAKAGLGSRILLRDSGIAWLGEIPAHWRTERLKFLVPRIEQGWSPECHGVPAADNEWGVLKAGCCNGGVFNPHENKTLPSGLEPLVELEVMPGDVLMSRASGSTELIGSVALVPAGSRHQLLLSDKIYRLSSDDRRVDRFFLVLVLGSDVGRFQVKAVVSGAAGLANNIAQTDIREFSLPLPPVDEQHAIVSYITAETAKLDAMRSATERTIALLKERRSALITAAVTGQIDVGSGRHYTGDAARQKEPERRR